MGARKFSRREALAAGAVIMGRRKAAAQQPARIAGTDFEIRIVPISEHTLRLTILPLRAGVAQPVALDGSLAQAFDVAPAVKVRTSELSSGVHAAGSFKVRLSLNPLTIACQNAAGLEFQSFRIDAESGAVSFRTGTGPLLGLGEGGPQFDRRGSTDPMRSGQGGYRLRTHGGRVPVPWIIGTDGWAVFFHQPFGTFDLTGSEGRFLPVSPAAAMPLDIFLVESKDPVTVMSEYARLTGLPEMPPLWSLGYQQSHRTLASREELIEEAKTFREKQLPCDTLIYLGTGFCPSGWNTANGSFSFNRRVFPDPRAIIDELHGMGFKVVLHNVILGHDLHGTVRDSCPVERFDEEEASCHWDAHRKTFALGVDGWWPDEGDPLKIAARLTRNRMYWEGPQLDRPNERPFALHRNGYAGMQRYASFLWSGDVYSTWETLRTHVPLAINTALTGIPLWGTDIGGFVPTKELTGELYVRWFQFGAFNPLFRAHGRTWKLRLPWGWNTGELGPNEITAYGDAANPDPSELHNAAVEPICKKYLELRYRLMPYLYSALRECCQTGTPVIRALWLQYPADAEAVKRGDEYLWGRDMLVAPVVEKGATSRTLYLPAGDWYDFWTNERLSGSREFSRPVDLATMPLYVRAGAILPLAPVKQYIGQPVSGSPGIDIYTGRDGEFLLYEDDGRSFDYRKGEWTGIRIAWQDSQRTLRLALAEGSKMLPPFKREFEVRTLPDGARHPLVFEGRPVEIRLTR